MTPKQKKKFVKLCDQMAAFMSEVQETHPHAVLFIEDGSVNIYDWPPEVDTRPDEPIAPGGVWCFASGGGR